MPKARRAMRSDKDGRSAWYRRNSCVCCGRRDFTTARDNFGNEYQGCRHCRLKTVDEIQQMVTRSPGSEGRMEG